MLTTFPIANGISIKPAGTYRRGIFTALLILLFSLGIPFAASAVDAGEGAQATVQAEHHEEHRLPQAAVILKKLGPWQIAGQEIEFAITNSMVVTWLVAVLLILFAQIATRKIQMVPSGAQNFWEWLVESLYNFLESIVGPELVKKTFWFFATIFIFILFTNWFGLIPGIGTVGWGRLDTAGGLHEIHEPLFRGANADLNMTFAMSSIFFLCWIVWAIQANGVGGFLLHIFGPKGDTTGLLKVLMIFVFLIVGVLEVVSIMFRPVSLSFRLYGNIFAGENMLESMAKLVPALSWLIPIPFYFMELLVGFVQALVFMLLTAVFTLLICQHEEGSGSHH